MDAASFYDNYITTQVESGINDRIHGLFHRVCRTGLKPESNLLEIGCGIGTLTYLLAQKITRGRIEAMDISPKSIAFAREHLASERLTLSAADILDFIPQLPTFDRITVFDVLEHIPLDLHPQVFSRISGWMQDNSLLLINIPNPAYILYDQQHHPDALQETDQPVYMAPLAAALAEASLDIVFLETWSVWVKEDYQFIVVQKRKPFQEVVLSGQRNVFQKALVWGKRKWRKWRYPFPKVS